MTARPQAWRIGLDRAIALDRCRVMGVLNITPDSFFDGGAYCAPEPAIARALEMAAQGADIIDIGGESTRPGAAPISAAEQLRRVLPVVQGLRAASTIPISIDTTLATVARSALDAGADIINDVAAGLDDADLFALAAARRCGLVIMHRRVPSQRDRYSTEYEREPDYGGDVADFVLRYLRERAAAAMAAGVAREAIVIDPGLGFGKTVTQNYQLIAAAPQLLATGFPVLSAASRKSFVGAVTVRPHAGAVTAQRPAVTSPQQRLPGTLAISVAQALAGVRLFRVHDVAEHVAALAAAGAIVAAGGVPGPWALRSAPADPQGA